MTAERIARGTPPEKESPIRKLKDGQFYELLNPTDKQIAYFRQVASRLGRKLDRAYRVTKGTDEQGTPSVRVYRVR